MSIEVSVNVVNHDLDYVARLTDLVPGKSRFQRTQKHGIGAGQNVAKIWPPDDSHLAYCM